MKDILFGAIIGDMCGSSYERSFNKDMELDKIELITPEMHFTDDTVCSIAIADAIIKDVDNPNFEESLIKWCRKYPKAGYGKIFYEWFMSVDSERPNIESYGNGSAMRVSSCGWLPTKDEALELARLSALPTHSHPAGIRGAQAIAECIWTAYNSCNAKALVLDIAKKYYPEFDFDVPISELRKEYTLDCTCQRSVPQAIKCYWESNSFEDCLKRAIWLGGDTDTIAAMAGSITYADYWYVPAYLIEAAKNNLPDEMLEVVDAFDDFVTYEEW